MGSFDGVCGLSRMAIGDGDPVIAMAIRQNPWRNYKTSPIYPYDIWEPASVLVMGKYADYGNVDIGKEGEAAWGLTTEAARSWYDRTWYPAGQSNGQTYEGSWRMVPRRLDNTFDPTGKRPDYRDSETDEQDRGDGAIFALWMAHAGIWKHLVNNVQVEFYSNGVYNGRDHTVRKIADRSLTNARALMDGEIPPDYQSLFDKMDLDEGERLRDVLRYSRNPWKASTQSRHDPVGGYLEEAIYDAHDSGNTVLYDALTDHFHNSLMMSTLFYQLRYSILLKP